jgi:hypothetical protein
VQGEFNFGTSGNNVVLGSVDVETRLTFGGGKNYILLKDTTGNFTTTLGTIKPMPTGKAVLITSEAVHVGTDATDAQTADTDISFGALGNLYVSTQGQAGSVVATAGGKLSQETSTGKFINDPDNAGNWKKVSLNDN